MKLSTVLVSGVVALAVAFLSIFGFHYFAPASSTSTSLGYSQSDIGKFPEGAQIGDIGSRYYALSLPAGVNQGSYRNTSGHVQYVDLAILHTDGVASSTFILTAGTSTAATFNSFSVQSNTNSLLKMTLATSSAATTTNSVGGLGERSGSGGGVAVLNDGDYLNYGLYQTYGSPCDGSLCEAATSTNRGFNVTGVLRVLQP